MLKKFYSFIAFILLFSCNTKQDKNALSKDQKVVLDKAKETKHITDISQLDSSYFKYNEKPINDSYWMPISYVLNLNSLGFDDISIRNSKNYLYEFIHIKNWKQKNIFSNSSKFEYKNIRVKEINDSTYYLTDFNTHHYKNKDSIFLAIRKNELSIITSSDSIPYCSNLGELTFNDKFLYRLQKNIFFFNKKYNIYDSNNNLLETDVFFDVVKNKIKDSKIFKTFSNRVNCEINYSEDKENNYKKCLIILNGEEWDFYLKNNDLFFEQNGILKYILKTTE